MQEKYKHGKPEERFWRFVDKRKKNGCWEWTGGRSRDGYGLFSVSSRCFVSAHRFSWALAYGPIPEGMCVLHKCDNRRCVNPSHLFLGTRADNSRDMAVKGRSTSGSRNESAKLSETDIPVIRSLGKRGWTLRRISERFGVSRTAIWMVLHGLTWRGA